MMFTATAFEFTSERITFEDCGTHRENKRVLKMITRRAALALGDDRLHSMHKGRLALAFVKTFNERVRAGALVYKARNAAQAEFNLHLKVILDAMSVTNLTPELVYHERERESFALNLAIVVNTICQNVGASQGDYQSKLERLLKQSAQHLTRSGCDCPEIPTSIELMESLALRFSCEKWIFRRLNYAASHVREYIEIATKRVNKQTPYLSKQSLAEYRQRREQGAKFLSAFILVNDELESEYMLSDAAAASVSNPKVRRDEMMTRAKGLDETARDIGHIGFFVTVTAPSKYHANSKKFAGVSPKATQQYLVNCWSRVRANLAKQGIQFSGLRTVEPHKDATPHWHVLMYCHPDRADDLKSIVESEYTSASNSELFSKNGDYCPHWRVDFVDLCAAGINAVGYITKYISKNIDGHGLDGELDNETGKPIADSVDPVSGWASHWRIRQFQFFGLAPVGIWRELRRIKKQTGNELLDSLVRASGAMGDKACYATYSRLNTGAVTLLKESSRGESYAEPITTVKGLACEGVEVLTRLGQWARVLLTDERRAALKTSGSLFAWSRLNNCNSDLSDEFTEGSKVRIEHAATCSIDKKRKKKRGWLDEFNNRVAHSIRSEGQLWQGVTI